MQVTKVALVGMGTVGTGVVRLLYDQGDRTARHAGQILWLEEVVVHDLKKGREVQLPKGLISDDLARITDNPEIKVVAHLVGGLEPARTILLQLLEAGKDVVTANKALLAEHGPELFDRARELGRSIAFDAAVAGGIPIITNIGQCFSANQIQSLRGILNGTSNFIVSQMEEQGADYAAALAEAQKRGFAEADPTMDVDGSDAAQKLAILAHLAFGARVHWTEIPRVGIDKLDPADLKYAKELGYRIKLIAVAQLQPGGLELHVSPTLVKVGTPLAEVRQAFNAISVVGDAVGPVFFHGLGAGQMPTASAVVADMIDTAVGRTQITFRTLELWSQKEAAVKMLDHDELTGRYYLRFTVEDRPGVLAEIAGVLGKHGISIASVIQHEAKGSGVNRVVPLVIMTYQAREGDARKAVEAISQLTSVKAPCVRMRVLDGTSES
ncbi:Homoserine dehydrogenase [Pirellula staleyi DSM 6068]|uniref:Homoserine dehydrogenase n=1 Tax=Pirellula staleyi (strain ATCC 27377 / DSM 6068 / ICPB 4128) TaxID=530564 RepID=D2R4Z1_PIRSD|nr:homoserine dehydrogenase [Pirellula staleyi]ADB18953.1 Homoserine dehydrogenase [Pirellula staleyi DSM 6068]